jgi:hypothetical protein
VTDRPEPSAAPEKELWAWSELYYASSSARSSFDCDPRVREKRLREFNRKFGERVHRLFRRQVELFGRPKEAIVVTTCRRSTPENEELSHKRGTIAFARWLEQMEAKLGLR